MVTVSVRVGVRF